MRRAQSRRTTLECGDRVCRAGDPESLGTVEAPGAEQTVVKWDWSESKSGWSAITSELRRVES